MHGVRAFVVLVSAVGGALAVSAGSAAADNQSAGEVISELQQQGYSVRIDRVGSATTSECVVTNVRTSQGPPNWVPIFNDDNDYYPFVVTPTASVSLDCTR
jgi:hypothetical protein